MNYTKRHAFPIAIFFHAMPVLSQHAVARSSGDDILEIAGALGEVEPQVWGEAPILGFQQIPHALLKNQFRMHLSPLDILIILNINLHWCTADNLPYPTIGLIARRIGVSRRSVERRIAYMEKRRLLRRTRYEVSDKGKKIRRFDLSNLVRTVEDFARRDPAFNARRTRSIQLKKLAAAASEAAAGRKPEVSQAPERPTASKPVGRVR